MKYKTASWLNTIDIVSTGSVTCVIDECSGKHIISFVEFADCSSKVRIRNHGDVTDYIRKLSLMRDDLDRFIAHLSSPDILSSIIMKEADNE